MMVDLIKHSQSTESNKLAISLQYLKKEVRNGVKDKNFYKWDYRFLIKTARHVQSTPKRNVKKFL